VQYRVQPSAALSALVNASGYRAQYRGVQPSALSALALASIGALVGTGYRVQLVLASLRALGEAFAGLSGRRW